MVNGNRYKINRPLACIVEFKSPRYIIYILYIIYMIYDKLVGDTK